jgi:hypothetical protein
LVDSAQPAADEEGDCAEDWDHQEAVAGEPHVQPEHEKHDQDQRNGATQGIGQKIGKEGVERFRIADKVGDDPTRGILVEIAKGKALDVSEEI